MVCRLCLKKVKTKSSSTSNLWSHLGNNHPIQHRDLKSAGDGHRHRGKTSDPTSQTAVTQYALYSKASPRYKEITAAITYYIVKDMHALYSVSKPGFRHLMKTCDRRYEVPSPQFFKRSAIPTLYDKVS